MVEMTVAFSRGVIAGLLIESLGHYGKARRLQTGWRMAMPAIVDFNLLQTEMSIEPIDPFERLKEFTRRSNAALDQLLHDIQDENTDDRPIAFHPEVDLVETSSDYRFYLSIPGMIEDDLLINIDGHHVTIQGERKPPYDTGRRETAVQEWRYGFFQRHFDLPQSISVSSIRAAYDSGVLTIIAEKVTGQTRSSGTDSSFACRPDAEDGGRP